MSNDDKKEWHELASHMVQSRFMTARSAGSVSSASVPSEVFHGSNKSLPVVPRDARSSWARAASASGYVPPIRTLSWPLASHSNRSRARHSSSSRSEM